MLLAALAWIAFVPGASAETSSSQSAAEARRLVIRGRLLDEAGAPVQGALVELRFDFGNYQTVHARSGEDGCFEVSKNMAYRGASPGALQVTREGFARIGFRWEQLQRGRKIDLGDQELARPAVLRGFLVDTWGQLLVEGWRVTAAERSVVEGRARQESGPVSIDPENGTFVIDELGPGKLRVTASGPQAESISATVVTQGGKINDIRMARGGQIVSKHVYARIKPVYGNAPAAGTVRAIAADGTSYALKRIAEGQLWRTAVLAPGMYSLVVDDPRFGREKIEGVRNGEKARVRLSGSASVRLKVVDAVDGARVGHVGVHLAYGPESSPSVEPRAGWVRVHPRAGRLHGLVPGDLELELSAPGYESARFRVNALAPSEVRELTLPLERGPALTGRVLWADGSAAPKVVVQAVRDDELVEATDPDAEPLWEFGTSLSSEPTDGARAQTDAQGRFAFPYLTPGRYLVRAHPVRWGSVHRIADVGRDTGEIELRLPPFGDANVAVRLPEGVSVEGLSVQGRRAHESTDSGKGPDCRLALEPNATSSFHALPVGEFEFELVIDYVDHGVLVAPDRTTLLPLGSIQVAPHAPAEIRFDVTETFPCRGTVDVWAGNRRASQVSLRPDGAPGNKSIPASAQGLWGFSPAGRYRVEARDVRAGWSWTAPEPIETRPGERFAVEHTVPLVEVEVRVTSADGTPLVDKPMTWWPEEFDSYFANDRFRIIGPIGQRNDVWTRNSVRGVTDELGILGPLRLPPDTYFFALASKSRRPVELIIETDGRLELVLPESSR